MGFGREDIIKRLFFKKKCLRMWKNILRSSRKAAALRAESACGFAKKCLRFLPEAAALFPACGRAPRGMRRGRPSRARRGGDGVAGRGGKDEAARPHGQAASKQTVVMKK